MSENGWSEWTDHDGSGCPRFLIGRLIRAKLFFNEEIHEGIVTEGGDSWTWQYPLPEGVSYTEHGDGTVTVADPIIKYQYFEPRQMEHLRSLIEVDEKEPVEA